MDPVLDVVVGVLARTGTRGWLVGGTVRDRELKRFSPDIDVAIEGDPRCVARELAAAVDRPFFTLSPEFGAHRVVGDGWHVDVVPVHGGSIEADLARRDFTVNAMALPLGDGELVDPFEGRKDLHERRLVAVGPDIFAADPLRLLRAARLSHVLGFVMDHDLERLISRDAKRLRVAAAERILAELIFTLEVGHSAAATVIWDRLGLLSVMFPEVEALRGVEQSGFHHLDVLEHTLEAMRELDGLMAEPAGLFAESAREIGHRLSRPVDGQMRCTVALRLATLLHDIAKPITRTVDEQGRLSFRGHTRLGGEMVEQVGERLRLSAAATSVIKRAVELHLAIGLLQHQDPPQARSLVQFLWEASPWEPEVILVSVSDRLAARGPHTEDWHVEGHLELARRLLRTWREREGMVLRPPLNGGDLMVELGIGPGPRLGAVLREVRLAWEAGEIATREEALEVARRQLRETGGQEA